MANTLTLAAPPGTTSVTGLSGTLYTVAANGTVTVNFNDIVPLLNAGFTPVYTDSRWYETGFAPAAANNVQAVASGALSSGTASIAGQVDYMRPLQMIVIPGAAAITAGTTTWTYLANDGTTQVDTFSLITALSTNLTLNTSKGVAHLTSVVTAGLVGGSSPTYMMGTTASLAVPVPPGTLVTQVTFTKENVDGANEAIGTPSTTQLGCIATTTAPGSTHKFGLAYTFLTPTS